MNHQILVVFAFGFFSLNLRKKRGFFFWGGGKNGKKKTQLKHTNRVVSTCLTRVSMEVIVTNVSKLGYFTYLRDVSNLPL